MTLPLSANLSTYGGVLIDATPMTDPESEISASSLNQLRYDAACMTRTSPRVIFQFTGSATAPALASTATWATGHDAHYGNTNPVAPVLTRASTGVINIAFPATVTDELGTPVSLNVRMAQAQIASGSTPGFLIAIVTNSSTIQLKMFNTSGAATDLVGSVINVAVY